MHRCWSCVSRFAPSVWTWGRTCLWVPWVRTSCWRSSPRYPETTGPLTCVQDLNTDTSIAPNLRLLDVTPDSPELDLIFRLYCWCGVGVRSRSEQTRIGLTKQSAQLCTMWILIPTTRYFWFLFFLLLLAIRCCFCWFFIALVPDWWRPMCSHRTFHWFSVLFYIQSERKQNVLFAWTRNVWVIIHIFERKEIIICMNKMRPLRTVFWHILMTNTFSPNSHYCNTKKRTDSHYYNVPQTSYYHDTLMIILCSFF